jgi:hypothetical protein
MTQTSVSTHEHVGEDMNPRSPAELVRFDDPGASVARLEEIAPPGRLAALVHDAERELSPGLSRRHPSCRGPSVSADPVVAPERRARRWAAGSVDPFATYALWAPFAHPGDVGDEAVDLFGGCADRDGRRPSGRTSHTGTIPSERGPNTFATAVCRRRATTTSGALHGWGADRRPPPPRSFAGQRLRRTRDGIAPHFGTARRRACPPRRVLGDRG